MDYLMFLAVLLASLLVVDYLAHERGWNRSRWAVASLSVGPLAIPPIYLVQAAYAVGRFIRPTQR